MRFKHSTFIFVLLQALAYSISYGASQSQESGLVVLVPDPLSPITLLGWSAAIDGDVSLVTSVPDLVGLRNPSGAVHHFDSTSGEQRLRITTSEVTAGDGFGASVDLLGTTAIVGTRTVPSRSPVDAGAFIFDVNNGSLLRTLESPNPSERAAFGTAVAISERWAAVGAQFDDEVGRDSGAVYTYDRLDNYKRKKIFSPSPSVDASFGIDIALDGNLALVGASSDTQYPGEVGAAYLIDLESEESRVLLAPSDSGLAQLGSAVDIDGQFAIAAAFNGGFGGVYVFDAESGLFVSELIPDIVGSRSYFGFSVAIEGDIAIVGAPHDSRFGVLAGAAYLFDVRSGVQLAVLSHESLEPGDMFGRAVDLDKGRALVAALEQDVNGLNAVGGAYVFQVIPEPASGVTCSLCIIVATALLRRRIKL